MAGPWDAQREKLFVSLWEKGYPVKAMAKLLKTSTRSINCKRARLGLPTRQAEEIDKRHEIIEEMWLDGVPAKEIAQVVGISEKGVLGIRAKNNLPTRRSGSGVFVSEIRIYLTQEAEQYLKKLAHNRKTYVSSLVRQVVMRWIREEQKNDSTCDGRPTPHGESKGRVPFQGA